ncbi:MAG TPA: hypothetical protein VG897_11540 [Terriglobales bacterium]|nr:hypothetical protein [Terriglobales bacterium]
MPRLRLSLWIALTALLLTAVAAAPQLGMRLLADTKTPPPVSGRTTLIQPTYNVQAGIDGEIFPALANYSSLRRPNDRDFGTFTVTITNSSNRVLNAHVSVEVTGWSDVELQNVAIGSGEIRKLLFAPVFLPRFYANHEIAAATALVKVTDSSNNILHSETIPVRLRSVDDMYWGKDFRFAPFIASWVTPHDPAVESILMKAKEFMPGRRLPGYEPHKSVGEQRISTTQQARAIYLALQQTGLSYVKSSLTFGRNSDISERVRMPAASIERLSANCIDGVVMYASLFENLGMDPVVVLVPGHAYVGVRYSDNSDSYLYIETAITGRATFETAVKAATRGLARFHQSDITRIPISKARLSGIYPMPLPGQDVRHFPVGNDSADSAVPGR